MISPRKTPIQHSPFSAKSWLYAQQDFRNLPSIPASTCKAHLPLTTSSKLCTYKNVRKPKDWKEIELASYCWHCPPALWYNSKFYGSSCFTLMFSLQHLSPGFFTLISSPKGERNIFTWPRAAKILAALRSESLQQHSTHILLKKVGMQEIDSDEVSSAVTL